MLYQPIKSAIRDTGIPCYDFIDRYHDNASVTVAKDTIGIGIPSSPIIEATYPVFRDVHDLDTAKYIFLFRNPLHCYSSDHHKFGVDLEKFFIGYRNAYQQAVTAKQLSRNVSIMTLEQLGARPREMFRLVCFKWNIPYVDSMIHWDVAKEGGEGKMIVSSSEMERLQKELSPALEGLQGNRFVYRPRLGCQLQLTHEETFQITKHILPLFHKITELGNADFPIEHKPESMTNFGCPESVPYAPT